MRQISTEKYPASAKRYSYAEALEVLGSCSKELVSVTYKKTEMQTRTQSGYRYEAEAEVTKQEREDVVWTSSNGTLWVPAIKGEEITF